jgi:hypothetical protein
VAEIRATLPRDTDIEIWWRDEARIGQKNKITRRWAKRGTRPSAPKDQRTKSAYIFGAICPARGVGAALVLPRCDTQAMQWHLDEIATQVPATARPTSRAPRTSAALPSLTRKAISPWRGVRTHLYR